MLDFSPRWTYSPQRMHTPTQELWNCIKPLETPFTVAQGTSSSTLTSLPLIQIIFPSYFDLWIKPNLRHLSGLQMFVWVNNSRLLFLFFAPWITLLRCVQTSNLHYGLFAVSLMNRSFEERWKELDVTHRNIIPMWVLDICVPCWCDRRMMARSCKG